MASLDRLGRHRWVRWVVMLVAVALTAAACSTDPTTTSTPAEETDEGPDGSAGAAGFGQARPAGTAEPLAPLEESDEDPFAVERIESTPVEDVPSALDDPTDPSFPAPLVDLERIRSGGPPPDGIPPIDEPKFERAATVDWLSEVEPVLVVDVDGDVRAYPVQVMTWHELVNDTIGGVPVTVSFCPLCNSALAYDRRVGERILDFGTSGRLFNSSLVMYDRQTESLWTHFDGTAVVGVLTGIELDTLPVRTTSWAQFRDAHPDGLVLSRDTGHSRRYGDNPYVGYDDVTTNPFALDVAVDGTLPAKDRVLVVRQGDEPAYAIRTEELFAARVIEFTAQGRDLVAVLEPGVASSLDAAAVADGFDTGATAVFERSTDSAPLELSVVDGGFRDATTGVTFDVLGNPVDGDGEALVPVEHLDTFWFAIAAFDPDTTIHGLES